MPKIVDGQIAKWSKEVCLLDQVWVKDPEGKKDIRALLTDLVAKTGENMQGPPLRPLRGRRGPGEARRRLRRGSEEAGRPGVESPARRLASQGQRRAEVRKAASERQRRAACRRDAMPASTPRRRLGAPTDGRKLPLAPGVKYRRILLKLSGEALMGDAELRHRPGDAVPDRRRGRSTSTAWASRSRWCIGGGNIFRGIAASSRGHGPRARRLHGHAGDGDQLAGAAGRAGVARRAHARAVGASRWSASPSRTSAAAPSATWRRGGW